MRVIDANELYRVKFHGYPDIEITPSDVNAEAYKRGWNDAIDAVAECAPAVEVVRCKDCKHRPVMVWSEVYDDFDVLAPEVDGKEDWRCPCLVEDDPYYSWSPNDNWFCGNGERREADEH